MILAWTADEELRPCAETMARARGSPGANDTVSIRFSQVSGLCARTWLVWTSGGGPLADATAVAWITTEHSPRGPRSPGWRLTVRDVPPSMRGLHWMPGPRNEAGISG